jgi:hypothetical protein
VVQVIANIRSSPIPPIRPLGMAPKRPYSIGTIGLSAPNAAAGKSIWCGQSPGGGHVDRNHIVGKPYRLDEALYKSSAHAWKKRRLSRTPLLHVLYRRACLEGSRRCTHQMMPSVAREAAWNLILNLLARHGVVCNVTTVRATEVTQMKFMLLPATFLMAAGWVAAPAQAAALLEQANVGGFVLPFANPRHQHEYRVLQKHSKPMARFAPHLPFAVFVGIGSVGWISAVPDCAAFDTHGLKAVI